MSPELRRRVRQIFEQALDHEGPARDRWLTEACGGDEALRDAVERLLRADEQAGDFLARPLVEESPGAAPPTLRPPDRVGSYLLREKIGEGGMGVVYRAVRDDDAFDREVAIKLLTLGPDGGTTDQRLRLERQILAALDHPWIAEIFDGGTTDEGIPFLVMEYVDGEPIDRYCDREQLSIDRRIELFRKVCAAVHCSHQNLVVHCDLKPSNILITAAGEPKLLDFGIAKLLHRSPTSAGDEPAAGSRPLTPEYASPEQLRGDSLSTASDVYSLGVLLYKLLTGQRPGQSEGLLPGRLEEHQTVPPSSLAPSAGRARRLRGDLDAIVRKALRTEPEDRFGSAEQLAEDLERHLDGFPVLARNGNLRYRAGKFLRRNHLPVAATAIGFAVLVALAVSLALTAGRLVEERSKLQEVVGFFRLFFERAGPLVGQGRDLTLREAVDQNAERIAEDLRDQPEVEVEIAAVLGEIYRELGEAERALDWSRRALELHHELSGEGSTPHSVALVRVGAALRELGRYEEAETLTDTGLRPLRQRGEADPLALVESLNHRVSLLCYQERYEEAAEDSATALRIAEERLDENALSTLVAIANRGQVLRQLGDTDAARQLYERALGLYRQTFGEVHPHVATLLLNLSSIQKKRGDREEAREALESAAGQYLELFGAEHPARIRPLVGLAMMAAQQERIDDALGFYREAVEVAIASGAPTPFVLRPAVDLGELLLSSDRCDQGVQVLRNGLEHCRPEADRTPRYAEIEGLLGECLLRGGRLDEARELLEGSSRRLQGPLEAGPEPRRRALLRLADLYRATGDEPALRQTLEALELISREPEAEE